MYYVRFDKENKDEITEFVSACIGDQINKAFSDDKYVHFIVRYLPKNKDKKKTILQDNFVDNIFCPKCGRETDESGKYCQWCGYDIHNVNKDIDKPQRGILDRIANRW